MSPSTTTTPFAASSASGSLKWLFDRFIEARCRGADARTRQRITSISDERLRHLGLEAAQIDVLRRTGRLPQRY